MNLFQLRNLHSVLGLHKTEIAAMAGMQYARYNRLLATGEFKPDELVNLCNVLRVPMGALISTGDDDVVRKDIQVDRNQWTNISYKPWKLAERADREKIGTSDIARAVGRSRVTAIKWMTGDTTMANLMLICSRMGWNLSTVIDDPTLPRLSKEGTSNVEINTKLIRENAMLRREISELHARIEQMRTAKDNQHTDEER